jgi:DNA-binding NarL/FixJ family response regulator
MPLRLLIADDERLFRQSLKILLETAKDIKVVAEASDGQEAVVKARETERHSAFGCLMPKMDGIKAAAHCAVAPQTKILMLSVHGDDRRSLPPSRREPRDTS